jgi:hypothetical protein
MTTLTVIKTITYVSNKITSDILYTPFHWGAGTTATVPYSNNYSIYFLFCQNKLLLKPSKIKPLQISLINVIIDNDNTLTERVALFWLFQRYAPRLKVHYSKLSEVHF